MFQFEGTSTTKPIDDAIVTGDIEVFPQGESLSGMADYWVNVPDHLEGYCHLMEESRGLPPGLGVTLLCQETTLDSIHKAFCAGATSRSGGLAIELIVDCPNNEGGEFWYNTWRSHKLRISCWKLYASAQLGEA